MAVDITLLTWINTLVIMAGVIVGLIVVSVEFRKMAEALARIEETASKIAETLSRVERLSLAILERVAPPAGRA